MTQANLPDAELISDGRLDELVGRLRDYYTEDETWWHIDHPICDEAADAIEALRKQCERQRTALKWFVDRKAPLNNKFELWGPAYMAEALREALIEANECLSGSSPDAPVSAEAKGERLA